MVSVPMFRCVSYLNNSFAIPYYTNLFSKHLNWQKRLRTYVFIHIFTSMTDRDMILVSKPMFGCVGYIINSFLMPYYLILCPKT